MKLFLLTQTVDKNDPLLGFMVGWITEFAQQFDEVHVLCLGKADCELPDNVEVYSLGKERGVSRIAYLYNFYYYFGRSFFTLQPQYIFFHMGAIFNILAAPFFLMRRVTNAKFMWWKAHGHINLIGKLALCFVDEVVTSTATGFPIATKKRRIIGQAIDIRKFCASENVERNDKSVVYVGRIMPVKHLEVCIETARILEPQGFSFKIVGPAADSTYLNTLKQIAADTAIEWTGPIPNDELPELYQSAGFFLNTSLTHSMDKTVLEAALCGAIPVTANRAFISLLEADGLYQKEQVAQKYATILSGLAFSDQADLRKRLAQKVAEAHSLQTFTARVFSNYVSKV